MGLKVIRMHTHFLNLGRLEAGASEFIFFFKYFRKLTPWYTCIKPFFLNEKVDGHTNQATYQNSHCSFNHSFDICRCCAYLLLSLSYNKTQGLKNETRTSLITESQKVRLQRFFGNADDKTTSFSLPAVGSHLWRQETNSTLTLLFN